MGQVAQHDYLLYLSLVIEIPLLLLAILSFLFADHDRSTQTILLIDFAILGVLLGLTTTLLYLCRQWERAPER